MSKHNGNPQDQLLSQIATMALEDKAKKANDEIAVILNKYGLMLVFVEEKVNGQPHKAGMRFVPVPPRIAVPEGTLRPPTQVSETGLDLSAMKPANEPTTDAEKVVKIAEEREAELTQEPVHGLKAD